MSTKKKYSFISFPALTATANLNSKPIRNGKPVTREIMQNMAAKYIERVRSVTTSEGLKKEPLVIYISKENITALMKDQNCKGLVAMLAVELNGDTPDHQTFALAPCDENSKIIPLPGRPSWDENWPIGSKSVSDILNNGSINAPIRIEDAVNNYFNSIGV